MSDPLGLFTQESNDPLGLFAESKDNPVLPASGNPGEVPSWDVNKNKTESKPPTNILDELRGINSSLQTNVAGMLAFPVGLGVGVAKKAFGDSTDLDPLLGQSIHQVQEALTKNSYKVPQADKYNEAVGELINQVGVPMMGAHVNAPKPYDVKIPKEFDAKLKAAFESKPTNDVALELAKSKAADEATVARLEAAIAKQNPQKGTLYSNRAGQTMSYETAQQYVDAVRKRQEDLRPAQEMVLSEKEQAKYAEAQRIIEERQQQMELEVKRQATLDNNAAERHRQENAGTGFDDWQVGQAAREAQQTHDFISRHQHQAEIDATPTEGPFVGGSQGGVPRGVEGRLDENGIPIRHDLSMEAQNLENPLQRNLWGDELPRQDRQEALRGITQALDRMPAGPERDAAIESLGGIGRASQRGAVDLDLLTFGLASRLQKFMENRASKEGPMVSSLKNKQTKIEEIVGKPIFAEPPKAESIVADSLASGKDGKGLNSMEAGSTLTAAKRNSPLVQGVSRIIQHAKNLSEYAIRETVFPVEKKLRALSSNEIIQLGKVMKAEMFNRRRLSTTELADLGLSEKQLLAYESVREMFSKALERENAAREAQGLKPITENEAYLSSRWKGDFRRAVHDANGKLVWYLAADSKMGLNKQTKALLKEFPDLVVKPNSDHTVRSHVGSNMNAGEMYSTMVDVLGRDDPAVARIQEWVQEQAVNEGRGMLAQEKHFKSKSNVRGFVGDRPSNTFTGKLDPQKEALDLFQEQITYSKNAHKWSGMQEAGQELKKIFSNKELADQQPNNMAYAKDYYRNQIGLSTHKAVAGLEDAIRQTGISPHVLNRGISNVKSLWITQKLAASVGFAASNIIQAANMLPHIADLMVKYGGNPLSAIATGISTGPLMALGHVSIARGEKGFYKFLGVMPKAQGEFLAKAMKYAEDNSVTARSVYDETPIASSFSKMAKVEQIAGKTLTAPETLLRSVSYMTYVEMLKSSGKFKNDLDIFRMAEERVNMSMADYRQGERAMLFDKMGTTGNMMNTLQTFPINFYQQWSWAAREAKKGNPLPAATMFAVQAYVAGAMGIPGFADTDKLWNAVKGFLADHSPGQWDKVKDIDLKQIVLNTVGEAGLYGGLSEQSGVSFTSRASAPAGSEMLTSPLGPYADLGRQALDVAGMVADPNKQSFAQAAMSVAPTGLQGALETGPLQDQTSVLNEQTGQRVYGSTRNLADRKGMVSRTPEEETIRKWGLRSQREVVEKDAAYRASKLESDSRTVIASLPSKIYNELRNNRTEKAKDLIGLYSRLSGKEITTEQIQNEAMKEYTTAAQRASMNATTIPGMLAIKRLQQIQQQK